MLVNTHMLIGQRVYNNIQQLLNINLDKNNFIYGNIKPDIAYRLSSKSHCMKDSLHFVLDEIDRLVSGAETDLQQFSIDLGVINHFLSDFFCSPHYHQSEESSGIIKHINYEYGLHRTFKKMIKCGLINQSRLQIDKFIRNNILDTILCLEEAYKERSFHMEHDIYYALRISTLASIHVLERVSILQYSRITA